MTGGWFSSDNVGDNAILLGLVDALRRRFDEPEISVITASPERVTSVHGLPAFDPKRTPLRVLRAVARADGLIFTGGAPFYSHSAQMSYYAGLAKWASLRGVPVVVFGISVRSFHKRYPRHLLARIASSASLLGAREDRSLKSFEALVGSDDPRVMLVPDSALQLQPADPETARRIIEQAGVDTSGPLVALSMRDFTAGRNFYAHHYSRRLSETQLRDYVAASRALIEHAVRAHGLGIVLCPMNTRPPDDDRRIMREVIDGIEDRAVAGRVTLLREQLGPREMKAILGLMRACVGTRFHSLVLATSTGVPSLSLAYAHKCHAIMSQMGQRRYSRDIATLDGREIIELFDELMENHSSIVSVLESKTAQLLDLYDEALGHLSRVVARR